MRKKRKKKRIGISLVVLLSTAVLAPWVNAGDRKPAAEAYALVGGTVFQQSGFALPNATITLLPQPSTGASASKAKKMQAFSDSRGEFVFRVPAVSLRYTLRVASKGYQSQEKPIAVEGEGRVDVTFQLQSESK